MISAFRDKQRVKAASTAESPTLLVMMEEAPWRRAVFTRILDKEFIMQTRGGSLFQLKGISDRKDKIMRECKIKE